MRDGSTCGRNTRWWMLTVTAAVAVAIVAGPLWAQRFRSRSSMRNQQQQDPSATDQADPNQANGEQKEEEKKPVKIPNDPRLLEVHKQFILNAEKLADEYVKKNEFDKARACFEEIARLVPTYAKGQENLEEIKRKQSTAETKSVIIKAKEGWQDTGVSVAEGKPVVISANGEWNFRVSQDLSADGMPIPKDFQDFNLGSLVGLIDDNNPKDAKPFFVGSHLPFTAKKTGRLLLRMYDADPSDNEGTLEVIITGTFASGGKRAPLSSSTSK